MELFGEVLHGWRKTGAIFFLLIWTLTLLLLILFAVSFHASGSWSHTTIFIGNCAQSDRNILFLRVAINIVATAILTSSNFFLFMLVAPAREDIDKAHKRSRWLEVGIPSLRNLRFITYPKFALWSLIAIASIPLHLFFNSSVYGTDAETNAIVALASEKFLQGGKFSLPGVGWALAGDTYGWVETDNGRNTFLREIDYIAQSAASWQKLDAPQCFHAYNVTALRDRRHLVVIMATDDGSNSTGWTLPDTQNNGQRYHMLPQYYDSNSSDPLYTLWDAQNNTVEGYFGNIHALQPNTSWNFVWPPQLPGYQAVAGQLLTAKYCLSEQIEGFCKNQVSNILLFVVFLCSLGKSVFCTVTLCSLWHLQPLSTVGDAIQSFICQPDPTTEGMCTFIWRNFTKKADWTSTTRKWRSRKTRCGKAVPLAYWLVVYILSVLALGTAATLFGVDVASGFWYVSFNPSLASG